MRKFYVLLSLLLSTSILHAQKNGSISGNAVDTLSNQPVIGATVTVLEKADSSLVTFTQTDNKGRFQIRGIPDGNYRLLLTHVNYHNRDQFFTINEKSKIVDLGNLVMNDRTRVLSEVVVSGEAPPITLITCSK